MPAIASASAKPLPLNPHALKLANAGLAPFVIGAILVWLFYGSNWELEHGFVSFALSAYAALVISFLGGIYWGLGFRQAIPSPQPFIWGVVPSLLAWMAVLMPAYAGLVLHGVMLVACYMVDRRLYPALGASAWLNLRFRLSAVASLSCFLAAAGS